MSQKAILWIVIAVIVILGAYLFFQRGPVAEAPDAETEEELMDDEAAENGDADTDENGESEDTDEDGDSDDTGAGGDGNTDADAVVVYTDDGFSPETVEVSAGGTVLFRNESSGSFWPASAIHPTHQLYPGSDIALCGTAEAVNIFDACGSVAPGGTYSFTFNEAGEWRFHNHLRATETGSVVVE